MANTLTQLQTQRDALILAIGANRRVVQFGDRRVEYNSIGDAKLALGVLDGEIARLSNTSPTRQIRMYTDSGWGN